MQKWILFLIPALFLAGCGHTNEPEPAETTPVPEMEERPNQVPSLIEDPNGGPATVDGIALVNKNHGLSPDYAPGENPEAKAALVQMQTDMINAGLDISWDYSGFRSYDYQKQLYDNYVAAYGQAEADRFSAPPGYSEHQTGLAFDLKDSTGQLVTSPTESQWLLDHAPEYGFIVRYLPGKEDITGYMEEPWHVRYIGDRAPAIAQSGKTLEEYLGILN